MNETDRAPKAAPRPAVPPAWEIDHVWRTAALDAQELLHTLQTNTQRAGRDLRRHPWGWVGGREAAIVQEWNATRAALSDLERITTQIRWLHEQADAALPPRLRRPRGRGVSLAVAFSAAVDLMERGAPAEMIGQAFDPLIRP